MQAEPKISDEVLEGITWELPLEVYTDGSGLYQTCPEARLSGWAIIVVQFPSNAHKSAAIDNFVRNRIIPSQFKVALASQTSGSQTVARSELQAAVIALECLPGACVYSDSQYVVDLAHSMTHCSDVWHHSSAPNFDLIRRLHSVSRLR